MQQPVSTNPLPPTSPETEAGGEKEGRKPARRGRPASATTAPVVPKAAKQPKKRIVEDDEEEDEDTKSITLVIGRRLALIREELSQQQPDQSFSQSQVAKEAGLTQNMIWRLERGLSRNGGLIKLLRYYEGKGYNISWILTEQNFAVSKLLVQQLTENVDSNYLRTISRQVKKVTSTQEKAVKALSDLKQLLQDMKKDNLEK